MITPPNDPATPDQDGTTGPGRRMRSHVSGKKRRNRIIAGVLAGAVVSAAAISLVIAGLPLLESPPASSPSALAATQVPSTRPTVSAPPAKAFAAFNRTEYVQPAVAASAAQAVAPTTITISADKTGKVIPVGLAGLSLDTDHMVDSYMNPAMSNLDEILKMAGDPVIRFGGQAADRRFFWTSTDEPVPNWKVVPAYKGDKRQIVKVTPAVLENVNKLLVAGNARVLLTANLGHLDAARTADFAKWANKIFGDRLVGLSLGNEPNGWGASSNVYRSLREQPWTFEKYAAEAKEVAAAVTKAAPNVPIVGPDVYTEEWWKDYVASNVPGVTTLAYHNYPLSKCSTAPSDPQARTIANMMSRQTANESFDYAKAAVAAADSAHLAAWNTETNVSSCGGSSAVTKNHASALWTVNYALTSATAGVTQLNFHGGLEACNGGAPMSPLCDGGPFGNPSGQLTMRPQFYGIMMVNKLGSGDFLGSKVSGDQNVYAYPVRHADGTIGVMVLNQNDPASRAPAKITLTLPAQAATGTMTQLAGPDFDAQDQTRIDGEKSSGKPLAKQARIPGFKAGQETITVSLNSGTASVLNFTFQTGAQPEHRTP